MALTILILLAVVIFAGALYWRRARYAIPLPPGPPGLSVVGNALQMNVPSLWIQFRDWSRTYGDVISVDVFGSKIIVLNTMKAVNDVLEKRSANFSDRPDMPMIRDLMGWTWTFALMRYGDSWREHRKNQSLQRDIQVPAAEHLLRRMAKSPSDFLAHLNHYTGTIIMKRTYGHSVAPENDPFVELVEKATKSTSTAANPPGFLVDTFPILKHVPDWMPGAGFKKQAKEWRQLSEAMVEVPYNAAKNKVMSGTAEPSFVSTCLEDKQNGGEGISETLIKNTAAVAYAAGVDTTAAALTNFMFAMVTHPEVVQQCQVEIDAVIGQNRLPDFTDAQIYRQWIPVLPLAVPHRAIKGEKYRDYWLPAGATIMPNTWAILHDEKVFVNPSAFDPQRFLKGDKNLPDPHIVFGYGRRSCAGKDMALDTFWLAVVYILAVFDIRKCKDQFGREINPRMELGPGFLCQLLPFNCDISVRPGREWATVI
ncbi:cytochrome P450 [Mucidula mucida]|nr:cytochrome P450 [Mucidula mucida]